MNISLLLYLIFAVSAEEKFFNSKSCPSLELALSKSHGDICLKKILQIGLGAIPMFPTKVSSIICNVNNILPTIHSCADDIGFFINSGDQYMEVTKANMYNLPKHFIPSNSKIVMYIHGWTSQCDETCNNKIKAAVKDSVYICVQWNSCSSNEYYTAANTIQSSSEAVSKFINDIISIKFKVPISNILLIGHSMGCHLAGRTGRTLQSLYNNKLNNIVGIDCAGPMFKGDLNSRIQDTDANNVISLMCSYAFGPGSSIYGTHNYIVNNGGNQPACASDEKCMDGLVSIFPWTKSCSHAFCCNLVAELLSSNSSQFFVSRCDCFTKCTKSEPKTCPLSLEPNKNCAPGLFSVYTNNNSPYAMGEEGAKGCKGCSDCYNCYPSFATVFSFSGDGRYCY